MVGVFFGCGCGSTISSHKRFVTMLWCHRTGMIKYLQHLACMSRCKYIIGGAHIPFPLYQTYPTERTFARHITLERGRARVCEKFSLLIKHVNTSVSCIWKASAHTLWLSVCSHAAALKSTEENVRTHRISPSNACLNWFIGRVGIAHERIHGSHGGSSLGECMFVFKVQYRRHGKFEFVIVDTYDWRVHWHSSMLQLRTFGQETRSIENQSIGNGKGRLCLHAMCRLGTCQNIQHKRTRDMQFESVYSLMSQR